MADFDEDIFGKIIKIQLSQKGDILSIASEILVTSVGALPGGFKVVTTKGSFDLFSVGGGVDPVTSQMLSQKICWTTKPVFVKDTSGQYTTTAHPLVTQAPESPSFPGYAGYLAVLDAMIPQYLAARTYTATYPNNQYVRKQTTFVNLAKFEKDNKGNKLPNATIQVVLPATPGGQVSPGVTVWRMDTMFGYDFATPPSPAPFPFLLSIPADQSPFILSKLTGSFQFFTFTLKTQTVYIPPTPGQLDNNINYKLTSSTHRKQKKFPLTSESLPNFDDDVASDTHQDNGISGGRTVNIKVTFPDLTIDVS